MPPGGRVGTIMSTSAGHQRATDKARSLDHHQVRSPCSPEKFYGLQSGQLRFGHFMLEGDFNTSRLGQHYLPGGAHDESAITAHTDP